MRFFVNFIFLICFAVSLDAKPLEILTSIRPIEGIASAITHGSDTVNLSLLMPKNTSPHHAHLKPSQIMAIQEADLVIWIGGVFETALEPYLLKKTRNQQLRLLGSNGLEFRFYRPLESLKFVAGDVTHFKPKALKPLIGGAIDGHIWLGPENAIQIGKLICNRLSEMDPANNILYQKNYTQFKRAVRSQIQILKRGFTQLKPTPYFLFHNAYQYFELFFDLHPTGVLLQHGVHSPSAKQLRAIDHFIQTHKHVCIFKEPQMKEYLLPIFKKYPQVTIGTLDPLGSDIELGPHFYPTLIKNLGKGYQNCFQQAAMKEQQQCD